MEIKTQTRLVTRLELVESQHELKKEMNGKIESVDGKVDNLRDMVLPLIESNKHIERNTERTADIMEKFTDEQRKTNDTINKKLNSHEVSLTKLGVTSKSRSETWKANAQIIVAVIGILGLIITGIFNIAPLFFQ